MPAGELTILPLSDWLGWQSPGPNPNYLSGADLGSEPALRSLLEQCQWLAGTKQPSSRNVLLIRPTRSCCSVFLCVSLSPEPAADPDPFLLLITVLALGCPFDLQAPSMQLVEDKIQAP